MPNVGEITCASVDVEPEDDGSGWYDEVDGEGSMATSSAWAVDRSLRCRPSVEGRVTSESREVHQSPLESRCISAYLRFRGWGESSAVRAR